MWRPLTIHYDCFLLALTSQAAKDSFSTGTNFSFEIINSIQTLRVQCRQCGYRSPERIIFLNTGEGQKDGEKLHQKTRCSLWCCLVDSIPSSYSNGVVFISALLFIILISVLLIFSSRWTCNEGKLWSM